MAIFEITFLFLGSIIGAGFATGAEIVTFFGELKLPIWLTASIIGITMFLIMILEILLFYPKSASTNAKQIKCLELKHNYTFFKKLLDVVFIMIYITLFTAMTAGIKQITNFFTCITSLFLCSFIALFNIKKLSKFNAFIVLIIVISIITTAIPHINHAVPHIAYKWGDVSTATHKGFLYAGLNCFIFPEIIALISKTHRRRIIIISSLITAVLITILTGLILTTIKTTNSASASIPLLTAAPNPFTFIIILLAILTSQYTALLGITQRLHEILPQTKNKPSTTMACICFLSLIISFCGFNHIIQFGYPIIGMFICLYLLFSFFGRFLSFSHHH